MGELYNPPLPVPRLATYVAANWINPYLGAQPGASGGLTLNVMRFVPFFVWRNCTFTDLGGRVTTGVAANNIQLAVYGNNPATMRPTGNPLGATGNIDASAAAMVSASIGATPGTLNAGQIYWGAVNTSSSTIQMMGPTTGSGLIGNLLGSATLGNLSGGSANLSMILTAAQTFGSWPDVTATSFTETGNSAACAMVFLKIGTLL